MTHRQTACACALFAMTLTFGPLGGLVARVQHRAEAKTIAAVEERAERTIGSPLTPGPGFGFEGGSIAPYTATVTPPADASAASPADDAGSAPADASARPQAQTAPTEDGTPDPPAASETSAPPEPLLKHNQMIVFYGSPISPDLGILGMFSPEEAARRVKDEAGIYDRLNGDNRGAFGALDLIYSQVQDEPTENGLYLRYLSDEVVRAYLAMADKYDLQLILDLQIGRSTVSDEVRKIGRFLADPRVHVAIDPEYAVGSAGIPIETPGKIYGDDLNKLQDYLTELVDRRHLPPKMAVIHQYLDETIEDGGATMKVPDVDLVLNMDAFGDAKEKNKKYEMFSRRPYASRRSFNIFLRHDEHALSENEALTLNPSPDVIFYQ